MVTSVRIALALVGCLSLVGCAAEPTQKKETPVDENKIDVPSRESDDTASDDSDSDDGDIDLPVTPVEAEDKATPEIDDRDAPPQGGDEKQPKPGTDTTPEPTPTTPTAKPPLSCKSVTPDGKYQALTTITYTVKGDTATITKMTVNVTNPDNRDQNDIDVYFGSIKVLNSGDILVHGKTVEVTKAKSLTAKVGTVVKLETNFDRQFLADPSASCTIGF